MHLLSCLDLSTPERVTQSHRLKINHRRYPFSTICWWFRSTWNHSCAARIVQLPPLWLQRSDNYDKVHVRAEAEGSEMIQEHDVLESYLTSYRGVAYIIPVSRDCNFQSCKRSQLRQNQFQIHKPNRPNYWRFYSELTWQIVNL